LRPELLFSQFAGIQCNQIITNNVVMANGPIHNWQLSKGQKMLSVYKYKTGTITPACRVFEVKDGGNSSPSMTEVRGHYIRGNSLNIFNLKISQFLSRLYVIYMSGF
jgi:hypothetical protein